MLALPPPPSHRNQTTPPPPNRIIPSPQHAKLQTPSHKPPTIHLGKLSKDTILLHQPRKTHPLVWCGAIICLLFSLLIICFGVGTLVIFLVIKPRYPLFDIPSASLNAVYFDSPEYFNGDFSFLANFTNPNQKIDITFESSDISLFYSDKLIATQTIQTFSEKRKEMRMASIHMISSLVHLPPNLAVELLKAVQNNKIEYVVRGRFKVRAVVGSIHFNYWLTARCRVQMTGPPSGFLVARSCVTKR
ncbi:hypothetical protein Ancab_001886 [Ancistrocladus abbreviatus]